MLLWEQSSVHARDEKHNVGTPEGAREFGPEGGKGNHQFQSDRQRGHAVEVVAEVQVAPGMDVGAVQALKGLPVSDDLGVAKTIGMTCSESHGLFYFPCSAGRPKSISRKS